MQKPRYIDLMDKVLSAYTDEHIERYYLDVKNDGLKEHGFPRLTANIGILIAHGRRAALKKRFLKMMDLCCREIPIQKIAANEFSVRELIFLLMELEKNPIFPVEQIELWKAALKRIKVENCYKVYAVHPDDKVNNWAAFTMNSEWMRYVMKLAEPDYDFIDRQAASQWQFVDENGMYRDPHEPMVYDLVTRGLFALLLHFGYRGKYYAKWDDALKRAGLHTLKMLSVTGELAYGGRSNQFLHNEAHCALIFEYEAARYAELGDFDTAASFKAAAIRSLDNIDLWLQQQPITHIKNCFDRSTSYGCENYAYFDKYMITAASFLYVAYLFCDDTIPAGKLDDIAGDCWQSSEHFHKLFLRAGEYFAEYDYCADYHYDASGLGRLHRKDAPAALALSTPGSNTPIYTINTDDAAAFAIAPEILCKDQWLSGAEPDVTHRVRSCSARNETASAEVDCIWNDGAAVRCSYLLDKNGLQVTAAGEGMVGLMLPSFEFDGKNHPEISNDGTTLMVKYQNWICAYSVTDAIIRDTGRKGYNRNGHYKLFRAEADKKLLVRINIYQA